MPVDIHQFPCLTDNYGFLLRDRASGDTACIDTPHASTILHELDRLGWQLKLILNTHWHGDHTGGNAEVKAGTGATIHGPPEVALRHPVDCPVFDGDVVQLGESRIDVLSTGGHTHQHVSYYLPDDEVVFVGDTLFSLGCGRLFEGDAQQMWNSLSRLVALPGATRVYCAHEYTAANARFALTVDDSAALRTRADQIFAMRERAEATVPTTIAAERATNPFLRAPFLLPTRSAVEAFAVMRSAKDNFRG